MGNKKKPKGGSRSGITVNSLAVLNKLHTEEAQVRRRYHQDQQIQHVQNALAKFQNLMTTNIGATDLIRTEFLRFLMDGPRDIDFDCGYPSWLTPDHYKAMYDREGIAKRVVEIYPDETWSEDPTIYEDEDDSVETDFETAWEDVHKKWDVWHYLHRIDILSGIGQFGILLMGIDDGKPLNEPVDGFDEDGTIDEGLKHQLLYIRPFDESVCFVKVRQHDVTNPRYSQPIMYTLQFRDFPNWGVQAGEIVARDVHWSRVVHVADNRKMSEVYGIPRMQPVYNRLYDLRKIYAASGEAFWKGAFPGLAFETDPDVAAQGQPLDKDSIRDEMARFQNGTQRYLAVQGVQVKSLPPQVVDPAGAAEAALKAIAITIGVPYRILFGSEEAQLAGDQDDRHWNRKLAKRQDKYVNPMIIRPFVDRLIGYGVLPKPEQYEIDWPDLGSPSDQEKAGVALTETQAMQAYVQGGVSQLIGPEQWLTLILGKTQDEMQAIMDGLKAFNQQAFGPAGSAKALVDADEQGQEEDDNANEGQLAQEAPDDGNALRMPNLSRKTTTKKGVRQVDPQMVSLPSLNKAKGGRGNKGKGKKRTTNRKSGTGRSKG